MKTFLSEVVEDLLVHKNDFRHTTLIVPGVRPKAFIRKTFIEMGFHGMLPRMITIEEFLEEITGLNLVSGVPLWFASYEAYKNNISDAKPFDEVLKFLPTLLKDFDDIDASLCDDKGLLDNLISEERIRKWGQSMEIGLSDIMKNHLGFWTDAQTIYYSLRKILLEEGKAYRGLLAKKACEEIQKFVAKETHGNYVYIGFNALTQAELYILQSLIEAKKATSYWDADVYYMNNPTQEAGDFLRKYRSLFPEEFKMINSNFEKEKQFTIVNVPKQETQAKYVGNYLQKLPEEELEKTAIVLADEQLLPAILNALPENVQKLNITMGLPLQMVPLSSFFKELFQLHLTQEKFNKTDVYYYKNVLNLLQHSNFRGFFLPEAETLIEHLHKHNLIFVSTSRLYDLSLENSYYKIFDSPNSVHDLLNSVISWINLLHKSGDLPTMEQEYLFRFRSIFIQLNDLVQEHDFIDNFKVLYQLYQQLLMSESVSFVGEPLVGLQLLGMLETRLLDFEHIILSSVNEGTLPLGRQENSFIPFDFRVDAKLNTFLDNDAIYAYHFYRLIQRCKSAVFLYNSDSEGIGTGEASRFLLQLKLESPHKVVEQIATPSYEKSPTSLLMIEKSEAVLNQLEKWKTKISPSSLGAFLYNPIDFYTRQILRVREEDEVEEVADDRTLGNIVHKALELLYSNYIGQILDEHHFKEIEKNQEKVFRQVVEEELLKGHEARGKNIIILQVAQEMISNVIRKDKLLIQNNELVIKELETAHTRAFVTPNGHEINFYGFIDRIDQLNGITRILDYKSGSVNASEISKTAQNVEGVVKDYKGAKAIQLAIYAYLMNYNQAKTGIYPLRYFSKDIHYLQWEKKDLLSISDLEPLLTEVGHLIDTILDPEIPFQELEK